MKIKPIKNNRDYREALKEIDRLMDARTNTSGGDRRLPCPVVGNGPNCVGSLSKQYPDCVSRARLPIGNRQHLAQRRRFGIL